MTTAAIKTVGQIASTTQACAAQPSECKPCITHKLRDPFTALEAYKALEPQKEAIAGLLKVEGITKEGVLKALQPEGDPTKLNLSDGVQTLATDLFFLIHNTRFSITQGCHKEPRFTHCTVDNFLGENHESVASALKWASKQVDKRHPRPTYPAIVKLYAAIQKQDENYPKENKEILTQGLVALAQAVKGGTECPFPTTMHAIFEKALALGFTDPRREGRRKSEDKTQLAPNLAAKAFEGLVEIERLLSIF